MDLAVMGEMGNGLVRMIREGWEVGRCCLALIWAAPAGGSVRQKAKKPVR